MAASNNIDLRRVTYAIEPTLEGMRGRVDAVMTMRLQPEMSRTVSWMQQNHPWQNRTGAAEHNLSARLERVGEGVFNVVLAHGVPYGVYLEQDHGYRFRVLQPAAEEWGQQYVQALGNLLAELRM